ncbi:MAG TPA: hypothetical protein VM867_12900 [Xanthobacteraceae bacterium]|nr:hypothetical protein [Xanthobacteraceae bacterium]
MLMGLIWTAVLVIAAQGWSGVAAAHTGHHAHHEAHTAAQTIGKYAAPSGSEQLVVRTELRAPGALDTPASAPEQGCIGGCCGIGIGCCGAALAGSPPTLLRPERAAEILPLIFERPSGLDPEALARPPRPLA